MADSAIVTIHVVQPPATDTVTVHVNPPVPPQTATATVMVHVVTPPQYIRVRVGNSIVRGRLGMRQGSSIIWLSPPLS